ncbi:homeobox protein H2.0 [Anastrepha ludens]|uniref:homeobox protein H2.0 n=1 Tax=Anastrepha ludens TaxID=28586 RepID=UPI0023B0F005|nr:homeobox protein H2.0 [Anastrepha ludens]
MGVLEIDQLLNTVMESTPTPTNLTVKKAVASDLHRRSESVEEMHVEFTKSVEIDNNSNENINATKLSVPVGETKIQLSFSVDRLLNIEETRSAENNSHQELNEAFEILKNCNSSEVKCSENANMSVYDSCTHPNCSGLVESTQMRIENYTLNLKKYSSIGNAMTGKFYRQMPSLAPPYLDFKSIVRPTPIRAIGNGRETVTLHTPYSSTLATSTLLRFQQQKSSATHPQMLAIPPVLLQNLGAGVSGDVNLGLKSFHTASLSSQSFGPSALPARFTGLKAHPHHLLDIPMSTASLINHHQQHHPHHVAPSTSLSSNHATGSNTPTQLQIPTASGSSISMNNINNNATSSSGGGAKRKRSWSRAVFSNLQRKGLEIQFQQQKYITKPDRRKLAARLNLTDAQVKVWFQNRRMKWRHTRENLKSGQEKQIASAANSCATTTASPIGKQESNSQSANDEKRLLDGYSSDDSSSGEISENDDEIDVVQ